MNGLRRRGRHVQVGLVTSTIPLADAPAALAAMGTAAGAGVTVVES